MEDKEGAVQARLSAGNGKYFDRLLDKYLELERQLIMAKSKAFETEELHSSNYDKLKKQAEDDLKHYKRAGKLNFTFCVILNLIYSSLTSRRISTKVYPKQIGTLKYES